MQNAQYSFLTGKRGFFFDVCDCSRSVSVCILLINLYVMWFVYICSICSCGGYSIGTEVWQKSPPDDIRSEEAVRMG